MTPDEVYTQIIEAQRTTIEQLLEVHKSLMEVITLQRQDTPNIKETGDK